MLAIELLPARGAALLQGELVNGTPDPQRAVQVQATLTVDEVPMRRRSVWCCMAMEHEEASAAANNPRHPHYARAARIPVGVALEPGQSRPFAILFPGLNADLFDGEFGAKLKLEVRQVTN